MMHGAALRGRRAVLWVFLMLSAAVVPACSDDDGMDPVSAEEITTEGWMRYESSQFEAALLNLAINAQHAMPESGQMTISPRWRTHPTLARKGVGIGLRSRSATTVRA